MPRAVDLAHAGPHAARIAVVDDDPLFLRVFAANLQSAGYQVACFDDPKQALASLLRDAPPDACVLDWNMPGLDGLALFKLLRARGVSVPVVFLTSYGQPIFEEAALGAGAVDFVDKSRGPAIILHRLSLALTRRDQEQVWRICGSASCFCRNRRSAQVGAVAMSRSAGTSSMWSHCWRTMGATT